MKRNDKYNRYEAKGKHYYVKEFPPNQLVGPHSHDGYFKCKLVHHAYYSLIVPDQIYFEVGKTMHWIQPLFFTANFIQFHEQGGICRIVIDISHGERLLVTFSSDDVVRRLSDGSILYRCTINGAARLLPYATGIAYMGKSGPFIELFHHTNLKAKKGIAASGHFWPSNWNIRGNMRLANIKYLYLTPLPKIACDNDLLEIAMSSDGQILLQTDLNSTGFPEEILLVERQSTSGRTETIRCMTRADHLAPQHIYRHTPNEGPVYYEIVCPFIQRLGVEPGSVITIDRNTLLPQQPKCLDYVVVGDATTVDGLRAPYDEEETEEILKLDRIPEGDDFIRYWRRNGDTDLYSTRVVETAEFEHV